jgi:hypothetical protein
MTQTLISSFIVQLLVACGLALWLSGSCLSIIARLLDRASSFTLASIGLFLPPGRFGPRQNLNDRASPSSAFTHAQKASRFQRANAALRLVICQAHMPLHGSGDL